MPTRQALYLVSNGIPFDVAFELEEIKRTAWCIMFNEIATGRDYNFTSLKFDEVK